MAGPGYIEVPVRIQHRDERTRHGSALVAEKNLRAFLQALHDGELYNDAWRIHWWLSPAETAREAACDPKTNPSWIAPGYHMSVERRAAWLYNDADKVDRLSAVWQDLSQAGWNFRIPLVARCQYTKTASGRIRNDGKYRFGLADVFDPVRFLRTMSKTPQQVVLAPSCHWFVTLPAEFLEDDTLRLEVDRTRLSTDARAQVRRFRKGDDEQTAKWASRFSPEQLSYVRRTQATSPLETLHDLCDDYEMRYLDSIRRVIMDTLAARGWSVAKLAERVALACEDNPLQPGILRSLQNFLDARDAGLASAWLPRILFALDIEVTWVAHVHSEGNLAAQALRRTTDWLEGPLVPPAE